ncbi:MAG: hypothetical protein LBK97_07315 [Prevotellaceae bacterium]|jgi:hypothetical protein|nr:hypothetical protein [Prevotellaceae bacterium]
MKLEIKKLKFTDLSGNDIPIDVDELCRMLGNFIYVSMPDLRWLSVAQGIHENGECFLDEHETDQLKGLIASDSCGLIIAVKAALMESLA